MFGMCLMFVFGGLVSMFGSFMFMLCWLVFVLSGFVRMFCYWMRVFGRFMFVLCRFMGVLGRFMVWIHSIRRMRCGMVWGRLGWLIACYDLVIHNSFGHK